MNHNFIRYSDSLVDLSKLLFVQRWTAGEWNGDWLLFVFDNGIEAIDRGTVEGFLKAIDEG